MGVEMMKTGELRSVGRMNKEVLLEKVRALVKQDAALAARLLVYLGEVDHRYLYA